jgi:hypothetical protein
MQDADDFDAMAAFTIKNQAVSDRKEAHARFASGSTPSAITELEKSMDVWNVKYAWTWLY